MLRPAAHAPDRGATRGHRGQAGGISDRPLRPPIRENPDLFYDAALHEVILFGGNAPTDSPHYANHYDDQTWAWNGRTWTRLHPAASPSSRDSDSLVYDPASRTAIMYGGYNDTGGLGDTWSFNGTTWTRLHPARSPGADIPVRHAAYDSASGQLVLYGGDLGLGGPYSQSTWTWSGSTWITLQPHTTAGPCGYGAMTYDQGNADHRAVRRQQRDHRPQDHLELERDNLAASQVAHERETQPAPLAHYPTAAGSDPAPSNRADGADRGGPVRCVPPRQPRGG